MIKQDKNSVLSLIILKTFLMSETCEVSLHVMAGAQMASHHRTFPS